MKIVAILSSFFLVLPALCAPMPQDAAAPLPVLADFYPAIKYGGTEHYLASGPYSTCLGIPVDLSTKIKSMKLGPGVKSCHLYETGDCTGTRKQFNTYKTDVPDVGLSPVSSLKCAK